MRRAFERMLPGLGVAALVSQLHPVARAGRSDRLMGYWKGLSALRPHRLVPAGALPADRVFSEQLLYNAQITGLSAEQAVLRELPAVLATALGPCPAVADVRRVLRAGEDGSGPAVYGRAGAVRGRMPASWRAFVDAAAPPQPVRTVSPCGGWVRDERSLEMFSVWPDGRLGPVTGLQPPVWLGQGVDSWRPAAVVWCPVAPR